MVFFNWATMQMAAKIVYYGPGLCGKTSNLSYIYAKTAPTSRGEMVSLETESDRTLFFDLLPIEVGTIGGFKTRLQLYTVPGQVFYNTTRKLVLKGVDGVVFVADSQRPMREANLESFASLRDNLAELNLEVDDMPVVLQYNKRDLQNSLTIEELNADLNPENKFPYYESSAINGNGVFETLKEITKLTLKKLRRRMAAPQPATPRPRPTTTVRPTVSPAAPQRPTSISAAALARAAEEGVERPEPSGPAPQPTLEVARAVAAELPRPPEPAARQPAAEPIPALSAEPEPASAVAEPFALEPPAAKVATRPARPSAAAAPAKHPKESAAIAAASLPEMGKEELAAGQEVEPESTPEVPQPAVPEELVEVFSPPDEGDMASESAPVEESEVEEVKVEFDKTDVEIEIAPLPPMKRVQVSNQMDILAELEDLRKQATMTTTPAPGRTKSAAAAPSLDLDSLIGGGSTRQREVRRRVAKPVNSDVFKRMHTVQLAIRIQDARGETIHTLDPVLLGVEQAGLLEKLSLLLTIDLENKR